MYVWFTVILILIIDRISKIIIQSNLDLGESITVIPGFFHITYILNPGAAFGMLAGQRWFFIATAVAVLAGIIYFYRKIPQDNKFIYIWMGMIAGGALGNLYDRLIIGKVIDFLDFKVWSYIFNFADSMIVVGGFLMVISIYLSERNQTEESEKEI